MPTRTKQYLNTTVRSNKTLHLKPNIEKHPGYAMNWWKVYSRIVRSQNPGCVDCKGLFKPNELVLDHVIPVVFNGSFDDKRNHQVLCCSCHSKKTVKEKKRPINDSVMNEYGKLIPKR
jgi:5-methylcytosine-specific restriction endonuclease McrA